MRKIDQINHNGGLVENWYADDKGNLVQEYTQDVEDVITSNKNLGEYYKSVKTDMPLVARLPETVYWEILKRYGYNPLTHTNHDKLAIIRLALDQPEYQRFRAWDGKLGRTRRGR